jgi:hypothetical protein
MDDGIDILTTANALGIYKSSYRPGKIRITGYYVTTPNVCPSERPGGNSKWYEKLESEQPHTVETRNIPVKGSIPEGSTSATVPASIQKKRRKKTRSCVPNNVIDFIDFINLTRNHVPRNDNSGLFELEIEDLAPKQLLQPLAEPPLTSADIKPSPRAR